MDTDELTLMTLARQFSDEDKARAYLENLRWTNGVPVCPFCKSLGSRINRKPSSGRKAQAGVCKCKNPDCRKQFTVTKGTVFESSHVGISLWMMCIFIMCSSKKGVSALQISRMLDVTYKTAWFMCHRIRYAMEEGPMKSLLEGKVEVDETYVGGKPRPGDGKVHKRGRGTSKTPVMVLVERGGRAISMPLKRVDANKLQMEIIENVHPDSAIRTDEHKGYSGIGKHFKGGHATVNHSRKQYKNGDACTNTAESYFAILKRGIYGTFHHVSKKHLHRYCSEFDFRWNSRKDSDSDRTKAGLSCIEGKRLKYRDS